MRAVTVRDGAVVVAEHPDPGPQAGEILVRVRAAGLPAPGPPAGGILARVRAAGLNGADILQMRGFYPAPPGSPADIPGLEFAGEVAECGPGVHRFEPGDRVMAVVGGGAQAELIAVNERPVMPVPDELEWDAAGGVPEVFTTAHDAIFT